MLNFGLRLKFKTKLAT